MEPFDANNLTVRLANALENAGLLTVTDGTRLVNRERLATMREPDLLRLKNIGRHGLAELYRHGLVPSVSMPDTERLAAIGRAVVAHLKGADNYQALREATPDLVIAHLRRLEGEAHAVAASKAYRVGRVVLGLVDELELGPRRRGAEG